MSLSDAELDRVQDDQEALKSLAPHVIPQLERAVAIAERAAQLCPFPMNGAAALFGHCWEVLRRSGYRKEDLLTMLEQVDELLMQQQQGEQKDDTKE